jgi:hypothetical protein
VFACAVLKTGPRGAAFPERATQLGEPLSDRKQGLRTLENQIRKDYEAFVATGFALKEIRDDELYKEDGFDTWERYCREWWEWSSSYVLKLITASEYRQNLPSPSGNRTSGPTEWSERSVRELTRIEDKREAARVAQKVIERVEQEEGAKLTSTRTEGHFLPTLKINASMSSIGAYELHSTPTSCPL